MEIGERKGKKSNRSPKAKPPSHRNEASTAKDSSSQKSQRKRAFKFNGSSFILPSLIIFRLLNALLIRTTFVPDEVWQSVEVAHRWVFGYGGLTWEWEPSVAIRSPIYPLMIAGLYKVMAHFGVDSRNAIVLAPRLFHGFLAGIVDYTIYKMAFRFSGRSSAKWVLVAEVTNWFTAYCAPRSLSNSIEWILSAVALRHYPWGSILGSESGSSPGLFLLHACLCVIIRPTAAILWAPVCLHYLIHVWLNSNAQSFRQALRLALLIGVSLVAVSLGVDRIVFGRWTVNQMNFLRFNFFSGGADFYGVEPWHWYLSCGLPCVLALHLPLVLIGWCVDIWRGCQRVNKRQGSKPDFQKVKELTIAKYVGMWVLWTIFAYSCIGHKEFRFLFPLFPLFMFYAGRGLFHLNGAVSRSRWSRSSCSPFRWLIILLVTVNLLAGGYTCLVHQRGPNTLMSTLGRQAELGEWDKMPKKPDILVLMPCHSTPSLSYLHVNTSFRQLACDPDLSAWHGTSPEDNIDEADYFYEAPTRWLSENYPTADGLPEYIAMFSELIKNPIYGESVLKWLNERAYSPCSELFNSHALSHPRHSESIVVWCAKGWNLDLAEEERKSHGMFNSVY